MIPLQDSATTKMDKTNGAGQQDMIAHMAPAEDGSPRRHPLAEHLREVGRRAGEFSVGFNAQDWTELAGRWHDLGKYRPGFQSYIRQAVDAHIEGKVKDRDKTHSAAGALHALNCLQRRDGPMGRLTGKVLAYLIAGHHAGLGDWYDGLQARLTGQDACAEYEQAMAAAPAELLHPGQAVLDLKTVPGGLTEHGAFALWVRMLFSCLVDADFLDTEGFMDEGKADARGDFPTLAEMRAAYNRHMARFVADTEVKQIRAGVLGQCRAKAQLPPGLFSLTVPTGGGKTLASLGFALDHALAHSRRRIIYAIPYTSIIEQTADVFRKVFAELGKEALVEHHSQAESAPEQETTASRLACENWDAPLVVTTNVQLFESLFAARTSRCRKLHNLVGSVIILDEAQQLPAEFLQPILDVLRLLVKHYGVTVMLCTATQPALASARYFDRQIRGLDGVTEIIDYPDDLYRRLQRVEVRLPVDLRRPTTWPAVAEELAARDCVLTIVNSRKAARELHGLLPKGALHLSALMCGAHRADTLARIKVQLEARRLGASQTPLRVVSTQLVEAGVDLDFPVVYRALAGLDSIAQAAGRCNREGQLTGKGEVVVFVPPESPPAGLLRKGADACASVLYGHDGDPLDRNLFEAYFRQLYAAVDIDQAQIDELLTGGIRDRDQPLSVSFRTASDCFRLICEDTVPVVVLYPDPFDPEGPVFGLLGKLEKEGPQRWLMRKLQRYTVSLRRQIAERMLETGDLRLAEQCPGLYVQASDLLYHPELGLLPEDQPLSTTGLVG